MKNKKIEWDWEKNNCNKKFIHFIENKTEYIWNEISDIQPQFPDDVNTYRIAAERMKFYQECYVEQELLKLKRQIDELTLEEIKHKLFLLIFYPLKLKMDKEKKLKKEKVLEKLLNMKDIHLDELIDFCHYHLFGT